VRTRLTIFAALATATSAIVLYPLFEAGTWFWRVLGAVVVVALTGLVTRRLRIPAVLSPLVALVTLAAFLTFCFARAGAPAGFVPTPGALARLAGLVARGLNDINHYAAPVPALTGIMLLTTIGVGVVAILVDLLAVRLRLAALAGLPLLALYSVPVAVQEEDIGWFAFALGATGYLALLVVDGRERVHRWGRPVLTRRTDETTARTEDADSGSLAAAGRRIGLAAVAVAVVVPLAVPGLHPTTLLGFGGLGGGHGTGTNTITIPDPTASLKGQISEPNAATVLSYTSTDPAPEYLRIYALDVFSGDKWTMSRTSATRADRVNGRTLPAPDGTGRARSRDVTTSVHVDARMRAMRFLPVPYPPSRIDVPGDWRLDKRSFMVFSNRDSAGGRDYKVRGRHLLPTRTQLEASPQGQAPSRAYLDLPNLPVKVRRLSAKITQNAASPYARAMAIQDWFTTGNRFLYSLNRPSGNGTSALSDFLLRDRVGYCEQFAAAMAVLARLNGIPSRVAIGYTSGTHGTGDHWVVTTRDAHAWPELFFAGIGWIRFEPTPSGVTGQGSATVPAYATAATVGGGDQTGSRGNVSGTTGDTPQSRTGPTTGPNRQHMRDGYAGSTTLATPKPRDQRPLLGILAAVVLLIAAAPRIARSLLRRRRWSRAHDDAARARAAWLELRDDARDLGWPWHDSDSPRTASRRITARLAEAARTGGSPARPAAATGGGTPGSSSARPIAATTGVAATGDGRATSGTASGGVDGRAASTGTAGTGAGAADAGAADAGAADAGAADAGLAGGREGGAGAALARIAMAEERARYAPEPVDGAGLAGDARTVRRAMAAATPRGARWRGRLLPPSTLAAIRGNAVRALDVFAWMDLLGSRLRRRFRRTGRSEAA
jgi:transglutaminase-like putative cysteine protease